VTSAAGQGGVHHNVAMTERTILLLRHAKSSWAEVMPDRDRPLNRRGRRDAAAVGELLSERRVRADVALLSPAERTRETWRRAADAGAVAAAVVESDVLYDAEPADIVDVLRGLPDEVTTVIVVAHFPGIPEAVAYLSEGRGSEAAWDAVRAGFPTSGLATLVLDGAWADIDELGAELVRFDAPRG